ncbi:MAG TPA: SRPBCC family protein [Thermoanaerobaculia bacterium]|nr:SRPBCC family protein [Thermoanaerobaculia bacterium]
MLKKIAIIIVVVIAILLIWAATRPDTFSVQRSATINAPPEKIFPLINDFHAWPTWSPWEKLDPGMKRTYSGAASGKGSVYAWDGNKDVGSGRMELTDSAAPSKVDIKLDFLRPFEAHNITEFTLQPSGGATTVTWRMHGPQPFFAKLMSIFFSMDKMVGKDFETGLANLKAVAEK